jgi:hypothetical protein
VKSRYLVGLLAFLLLAAPVAAAAGGHYLARPGDAFHYSETTSVTNGTGDYASYTEQTVTTGSISVTGSFPNGTVSANYASVYTYTNSSGGNQHGGSSGTFSFSTGTFLYVQGTDNQTGYTNPAVWFYVNSSVVAGDHVELLNTPMTVESTDATYSFPGNAHAAVQTISAQGSGSYLRNDSYGMFTAEYTWTAYFDPATGYIVGYSYTEQDSNNSGDGFTYTDILYVTSTTYALTPASSGGSSGLSSGTIVEIVVAVVVLLIIVVVVILALRSRRRAPLPRHSATGRVEYGTMGMPPRPPPAPGAPPPPIRLTAQQPAVQQVVVRETVKVNCRFCGTLIDSTATVCPNCGAPRT